MEIRLEGDDGAKTPPYMTQPEGPRWWDTFIVAGYRVEVETVDERGVLWTRHRRADDGRWSLWRSMERSTDGAG